MTPRVSLSVDGDAALAERDVRVRSWQIWEDEPGD